MIPDNMLATVDLGSNSFRLQICQNQNGQLQIIDSIKEMVRFAAGLDQRKMLDEASQERALACLAKFGERLRGFPPEQVRTVATNTFRVAKNIDPFIPKAEAALGFPIEVIAGREEARLIYTGVVHTLPPNGDKMLVVDIGGGSTEFVIGSDLQPTVTESLNLGCVTYSMRFFPKSKVGAESFRTAVTAARGEIQRIGKILKFNGWDFAVGTSGSARAIRDVGAALFPEQDGITLEAMQHIVRRLIGAGSTKKARLEGLKADRIEVFAGGLAVMTAVFEELGIRGMTVTDAALRDGVFYDLIGRQLNEDMRDQTIARFQQRYHVGPNQAERVAALAEQFFGMLSAKEEPKTRSRWQQYLRWAALVHEIGIDIAHTAYHKHSAYILEQADMPGFSRKEQHILSLLVLGHRGDVRKLAELLNGNRMLWFATLSLRLAALFCRGRLPLALPDGTTLDYKQRRYTLCINRRWLDDNPLTAGALADDAAQWQKIGLHFEIVAQ
ncbi:MAG: exopolyphosphatase [Eikenella sp.]|nr:exopolyphosphatase [Eikenella sp.]